MLPNVLVTGLTLVSITCCGPGVISRALLDEISRDQWGGASRAGEESRGQWGAVTRGVWGGASPAEDAVGRTQTSRWRIAICVEIKGTRKMEINFQKDMFMLNVIKWFTIWIIFAIYIMYMLTPMWFHARETNRIQNINCDRTNRSFKHIKCKVCKLYQHCGVLAIIKLNFYNVIIKEIFLRTNLITFPLPCHLVQYGIVLRVLNFMAAPALQLTTIWSVSTPSSGRNRERNPAGFVSPTTASV